MTNKNLKLVLLFSIGSIIGLCLLLDQLVTKSQNKSGYHIGMYIGDCFAYVAVTVFFIVATIYFGLKYKNQKIKN